jgi:hypothetical protein
MDGDSSSGSTRFASETAFAAVTDSIAGLALAFGGLGAVPLRAYWLPAGAAALHLGGLALERNVGRSRMLAAAVVGVGVGFASAAGAPGMGLALATAIVLYHGVLKGKPLGFLNLGLCRGLDLSMALAIAPRVAPLAVAAAASLAAYASMLAWLSPEHVDGSGLLRAQRGVRGLAILSAVTAASFSAAPSPFFGGLLLFALFVRGSAIFAPLWTGADAETTARAIGEGLRLLPVLDASFVAASGYVPSALLVASPALPAMRLRWPYSSS